MEIQFFQLHNIILFPKFSVYNCKICAMCAGVTLPFAQYTKTKGSMSFLSFCLIAWVKIFPSKFVGFSQFLSSAIADPGTLRFL